MRQSSVPPAVARSISSLIVRPMAETLLATEQGELRMRGGAHRFVSLPLAMTARLIDDDMAWPF